MASRQKTGGRKKGTPNKATKEIKTFARKCLSRPEYIASLKRRLDKGDAPHMETLLHHYAYGKPREGVDFSGTVILKWKLPI